MEGAASAVETNNMFNLKNVHSFFEQSLMESGDIDIKKYVAGYKELNKFFELLGSIFNFVSHDLETKINYISKLLSHENLHNAKKDDAPIPNFKSIEGMLDVEKSNALWNKAGYVSGSRTVLRLHRGLEFIRMFLQDLYALDLEQETSDVCRGAYANTLAKHHPWYIRKTAELVMFVMPPKHQLLLKVCGTEEKITESLEGFPETLTLLTEVYNRTQTLYEQYGALDLP